MALSYREYVDWLYGLQKFGIKLGLEKISLLLEEMGNPHEKYPSIHIAGTNGKGSVAAMISAVLQSHGLKTGLYTSPHLVRFSERIKIDGKEIEEEVVVNYSQQIQKSVDTIRATFFETTTAMAFKYFADNNVDVAVIETGLGGRFDATNVVMPVLSVITSVGLEHQQYLGHTLARIAYEKGGIIKDRVPVVSGVQSARAIEVLREIAEYTQSPIIEVTPSVTGVLYEKDLNHSVFDVFFSDAKQYEKVIVGLPGLFQIQNALIAIRALDVIRGRVSNIKGRWEISEQELRNGLEHVGELTGVEGRMQLLEMGGINWILDVAHNPGATRELVRSLADMGYENIPVIFGVLNDKDVKSMLKTLSKISKVMYVVEPRNERAIPSENLKSIADDVMFPVIDCGKISNGIQYVKSRAGRDEVILVTGSHFVVGEALEILK